MMWYWSHGAAEGIAEYLPMAVLAPRGGRKLLVTPTHRGESAGGEPGSGRAQHLEATNSGEAQRKVFGGECP